ncbi:2-polyprenyl-6-methoxyphenol hydroxylase [Kytococcus aerolatus]|uniref:2-polyprenyl-6-methoxyphenol hydroxylase n=1 Tax=Kytococcus aerolatus TaxID=592308 RepID=A0A212TFZ9_9MICO|nr:FAD-dependent oxidoreductase [Kytococcus aerolatus]SNC64736.1 2-polyprenyl-6-methoxyphenol hydroxylase [Kytococcus aerolatus]
MMDVVVGGGIAGLATAVGLARAGRAVTVLERRERIEELGAGIILWPNALRALGELGLREQVHGVAELEAVGGLRRPDGEWLNRVDGRRFSAAHGEVAAIHRGDLIDLLHEAAVEAGVEIRCGQEVVGVESGPQGGATVVAAGGRHLVADLVLGADGLRSAVREAVFPAAGAPQPTGLTAWRWVVDAEAPGLPAPLVPSVTIGAGTELGIVPLPGSRAYCYFSSVRRPDGTTPGPEQCREWHDPIPSLVAAGEAGGMLCHELWDLPPLPSFVHPNLPVALVGDAAHAMTPHLGQGAAQGLEDAAALACLVKTTGDARELLGAYDRERGDRARAVQRASRQAMGALTITHPALVAVRDALIRLLPGVVVERAMARWVRTG